MADHLSPEKRSENMRAIKSKNTTCEMILRKALWREGLRGYRTHYSALPGKPDVAFTKQKVAVFVDGCFWHGCPNCCLMPQTNSSYWVQKIDRNVARSKWVATKLKEMGWTVIRLWEHEVLKNTDYCVCLIRKTLKVATQEAASPDKQNVIRKDKVIVPQEGLFTL